MSKATIANYLINNLSDRFPFSQSGIIDHDIIEVMIQNWDHNHYPTLDFNHVSTQKASVSQRILM
jgi:hypothetical protein